MTVSRFTPAAITFGSSRSLQSSPPAPRVERNLSGVAEDLDVEAVPGVEPAELETIRSWASIRCGRMTRQGPGTGTHRPWNPPGSRRQAGGDALEVGHPRGVRGPPSPKAATAASSKGR